MRFTKQSNGRELVIEVDKEGLIKAFNDFKKDEEYLQELCELVHGNKDDTLTEEEIIQDLDEFISKVEYLCENPDELFNYMELKKNGTFKLNSKPIIKEAINGCYWEDCYGWSARVLRLIPGDDTFAKLIIDNPIIHY